MKPTDPSTNPTRARSSFGAGSGDTVLRVPTFRALRLPAILLLAFALTLGGCKGADRENPILALSADESLSQGKQLMAEEKYAKARPYLLHAFEVEPNSVKGREALLLAADTFYLEGNRSNYLQAEAKYRDFLNRFPTSDRAAYAQFQAAASLAKRMERPDRDQTVTRQALQAFEDLLRLYPTSEYAAQARDQIRLVRDNLAEHEFVVGEFYLSYGIPIAAVGRFEYLLENYPEYSEQDKAYFYLGRAYAENKKREEAAEAFDTLRRKFPESPYIQEIPDLPPRLDDGGAPSTPAMEEAAEAAAGTDVEDSPGGGR